MGEFNNIKTTLLKNRYLDDIITSTIRYKCMQFSANLKFGPEDCPICRKLTCIGNVSMQLIEQIKRFIGQSYNSVKLRVMLKSNSPFPPNLKDTETYRTLHSYKIIWAVCHLFPQRWQTLNVQSRETIGQEDHVICLQLRRRAKIQVLRLEPLIRRFFL